MTNYCIFLPIHLLKCCKIVWGSMPPNPTSLECLWCSIYSSCAYTFKISQYTPPHCNSKSITNYNYYYHHISQLLHALWLVHLAICILKYGPFAFVFPAWLFSKRCNKPLTNVISSVHTVGYSTLCFPLQFMAPLLCTKAIKLKWKKCVP